MAVKLTQNEIKKMTPTSKLSEAKKKPKREFNITIPILKTKKKEQEVPKVKISEMDVGDYSLLNMDEQMTLFNAIKNVFVKLREDADYMDIDTFEKKYFGALLEVLNLAVTGNVAAMDYLCYAYKKGMEGALPVNLTLAHKWGMLAIANGSKLSVDRMRMFLTPMFEYVENSDVDLDLMMSNYDVPDGDAIFFVSETFAGLYNPKMGFDLLSMARENPGSSDSNFQKFIFEANKKRDEILPTLLKYLK